MLASMFAPMPIHNNMNMATIPNMNQFVGSMPSFGQMNTVASPLNNLNNIRAMSLNLSSLTPSDQLSFLNNMQQMNAIQSPHNQNRAFQSQPMQQPMQTTGQQWTTSALSMTPSGTPRFLSTTPPANLPGLISMNSAPTGTPAQARTITTSVSTPSSNNPQGINHSSPFYSTSMSGGALGMVNSQSHIPLASIAASQPIFAQPAIPHLWQPNLDQPVSPNTTTWDRPSAAVYVDSPATSFGHLDKSSGARDTSLNAFMEIGDDHESEDEDAQYLEKRNTARRNSSNVDVLLRTVKSSLARMDEMIAKPDVDNEYSTALSEIRSALCSAAAKVTNATVSASSTPNSFKKRKSVDEDPNVSPLKRVRSDEDDDEHDTVSEGDVVDEEEEERGQNACKPCPLLEGVSKKPIKVLFVNVQRQYTVSKRETLRMSKEERERLIPVHVRIMGNSLKKQLYFVAKDVCLLIHTRKGNVAKSIGQFKEDEKVRMSVICPRSNGTVSTHILTALTLKGVKRLLTSSRSPLAPLVHKWILKQVEELFEEAQRAEIRRRLKKREKLSASAPGSQSVSPIGSNKSLLPLPMISSENRNGSSSSSHSSNHMNNSPYLPGQSMSPASQSYPASPNMNSSSNSASVNAKLVALAQLNRPQNSNGTYISATDQEFSNVPAVPFSSTSAHPISSMMSAIPQQEQQHHLDNHEMAKGSDDNSSKNAKTFGFSDNSSGPLNPESSSASLTTLLEAIKVRSDKNGVVINPQQQTL